METVRPNEAEEFEEGADCECHDYPEPTPLEEAILETED